MNSLESLQSVKSSPRNPTNVWLQFTRLIHFLIPLMDYNGSSLHSVLCYIYMRSWFNRIEFHSITITTEKLHKNSDDEKKEKKRITCSTDAFERFVSSDSCSFESDGGMYWVNISCMKWIIYATKRIFHDIFSLLLSLWKAASTEEMEFSDIACIDRNEYRDSLRWVMKFSDWTFKWKIFLSLLRKIGRFMLLLSLLYALQQRSELVAKFIYENCYDTFCVCESNT